MIIREVLPEEKNQFNALANHPLQSWEWGEFRQRTGLKIIRLGAFDPSTESEQEKMKAAYQLTIHPVPLIGYRIVYFPKGPMPDQIMLDALKKIGLKEKTIMIKIEPNIIANQDIKTFLLNNRYREGKSFFTKYTFILNLDQNEEQILAGMKQKTRYNIRLAQKHGVQVIEDNSLEAFEFYLHLTLETGKRQGFYAHTAGYHRKMWETLVPSGMYHLFKAVYQNQILATYIFFTFNNVLYYPYGASSREYREVMPAYALFWEAIKFGQKMGCKSFDTWGCLGPNPDPKDPWVGFHRFKEGFGGKLVELLGTYDLPVNPTLYSLFNTTNDIRWKLLSLKKKFFLSS